MTSINKYWRALALLSTAFALTACGGSNESGSAAGASNTTLLASTSSKAAATADFSAADFGVSGDFNLNHGSLKGLVADIGLFPNEHGVAHNHSSTGRIDTSNPFFKPFGNGRTCATCHVQGEGFSMTPAGLKERFNKTAGKDPVFMLHDGANSPNAPVGTLAQKRAAYSLLLNKGLIRIGQKIPDWAEFELVSANDPYNFAGPNEISMFRRPLPSANLKFLTEVMWDDRETALDPTSTDCLFGFLCFASLDSNLGRQAVGATTGHAQHAAGLTDAEMRSIVAFEKTLFSAQVFDKRALLLTADGAKGGTRELINTDFYLGINDSFFGNIRTGAPFDINVMKVYSAWGGDQGRGSVARARQSIARGEKLFNTKTFNMIDVGGINDDFGIPVFENATCTTCHNGPQVGSNSFPFPGGLDLDKQALPDMPTYVLRNKFTGETVETQDPGAAMVTGRWKDIGRFKTPTLRGMASRPPYFHDGSAATIKDTVLFYNRRFGIGYTQQEIDDVTAFLASL